MYSWDTAIELPWGKPFLDGSSVSVMYDAKGHDELIILIN